MFRCGNGTRRGGGPQEARLERGGWNLSTRFVNELRRDVDVPTSSGWGSVRDSGFRSHGRPMTNMLTAYDRLDVLQHIDKTEFLELPRPTVGTSTSSTSSSSSTRFLGGGAAGTVSERHGTTAWDGCGAGVSPAGGGGGMMRRLGTSSGTKTTAFFPRAGVPRADGRGRTMETRRSVHSVFLGGTAGSRSSQEPVSSNPNRFLGGAAGIAELGKRFTAWDGCGAGVSPAGGGGLGPQGAGMMRRLGISSRGRGRTHETRRSVHSVFLGLDDHDRRGHRRPVVGTNHAAGGLEDHPRPVDVDKTVRLKAGAVKIKWTSFGEEDKGGGDAAATPAGGGDAAAPPAEGGAGAEAGAPEGGGEPATPPAEEAAPAAAKEGGEPAKEGGEAAPAGGGEAGGGEAGGEAGGGGGDKGGGDKAAGGGAAEGGDKGAPEGGDKAAAEAPKEEPKPRDDQVFIKDQAGVVLYINGGAAHAFNAF